MKLLWLYKKKNINPNLVLTNKNALYMYTYRASVTRISGIYAVLTNSKSPVELIGVVVDPQLLTLKSQ